MKNILLVTSITCSLLFVSCQSEEYVNLGDKENVETTYISVGMPEYNGKSRVSYDDLKLGLYWEDGDQLEIVSQTNQSLTGSLVEGVGKTTAIFEVPTQGLTKKSYAYYKAENLILDQNGVASINYESNTITQYEKNPTAHLKKNLLLKSVELTDEEVNNQDIKMSMLNSIFRFDIQSVPDYIKNITHVEWISNFGTNEEKKIHINLPTGKLPTSLFLCFDPIAMSLKAGQKIALKFFDDKNEAHVVYATSVEGKEYKSGSRYYASVGTEGSGADITTWATNKITDGKIHITEEMYTKENLSEVLADDKTENFGGIEISTGNPISASLTEKGELVLTNYAPIPAQNVKVFCKIAGVSEQFLEVAEYDKIYGFSQSKIKLPFASERVQLKTKEGKTVEIPLQTGIKSDNFQFKIEVDSPTGSFWERTYKTTRPIKIAFSKLNDGAWKPLDSKGCRMAVVIGMTMSYMFNHPDYEKHVMEWNTTGYIGKEISEKHFLFQTMIYYLPSKPFKDEVIENGVAKARDVEPKEVLDKLYNRKRMEWSELQPGYAAAGLATLNYDRLGFKRKTFEQMCNWQNLKEKNPMQVDDSRCKVFDRIFHEFAHNMGYQHQNKPDNHLGSMTYGGGWTTCNYVFLRDRLFNKNEMLLPLDGKWETRTEFPKNL